MKNPFLNEAYIGPNVSLNKLILAKLPIKGVQDDIEGKTAFDSFCTRLFVETIKQNAKLLKLDLGNMSEKDLPIYLGQCIDSSDFIVSKTSDNIVKVFGERLGLILLTLKKGEAENRLAREDWNQEHWDYWRYIQTVILVGGLASGKLGEALRLHINRMFALTGEGYEIVLVNDSQNAGIRGCAEYINEQESTNLIFDFGQTYIKRSLVNIRKEKLDSVTKFDKLPSQHIESDSENLNLEKLRAIKLHEYLVKNICDTYNLAKAENSNVNDLIIISIANYVKNGVLFGRGGYAKLRLLADNYETFLAGELSIPLKRSIRVKMVHDGTAMAAAFKDYDRAVCISLGTAFGVGFPN